ncbi:3-hydroxyacyl-CoA dehydrogenase NAD-binding domain-containing protein [Histidinibacterium aquaticum]|uniref:3-hydroxyacyl-CoA dehydrogenase n=1 Tax=Histidinibacterium aquaticum TaxID=2613962 RepID=A0A5J5GMZ9_9RHOB|nr:3-hydroxyacyl-CoA dehydrogenase NAD-binding domain-containing protein [Histidinibacterium aquaticum]KAA9008812.1 3-hydroxyacyl-CoA dehydrogenase [Histidinibacterium aquaticum]
MNEAQSVLILGAGPIGTGFAAAFLAAQFAVTICDPDEDARSAAPGLIGRHGSAMELAGLPVPRGRAEILATLPERITQPLVIEAGPERLEPKQALFRDLLTRIDEGTVIATASSAIPVSRILPEQADQSRCLVAHPANPPSLLRVLELVPAPGTKPEAIQRAEEIFRIAGYHPALLGREVPAFVFNRLQSALLREAYRLVDEGVIGVDALDGLVRDGLGPRWALSGPFETADLNTAGGIRGHAERLGPAYAAIGHDRGETNPNWSPALVDKVEAERRAILPEDDLPARRAWREEALARLLDARREILKSSGQ